MTANPFYDAACAALEAGISVVPPTEDGEKRPYGTSWAIYQRQRPTAQKLAVWYLDQGRTGVGFVCGAVSGNLEMLEAEGRDGVYEAFVAALADAGLGDLWNRIATGYLSKTPGGGRHALYRCAEVGRNAKLARRPTLPEERAGEHDDVRVLIETRGEGGFTVEPPSNGRVHPSGGRYEQINGGVGSIATIAPQERADLFAVARTFDRMPIEAPREPRGFAPNAGGRPGDDFNARGDLESLMVAHGWRVVYRRGATVAIRRPGKDRGISATINHGGSGFLYVFTSSTPFEADRSYTPFGAFAVLEHGGDFGAAARDLARQGYGERRQTAAASAAGGNADGAGEAGAIPDGPADAGERTAGPYVFRPDGITHLRATKDGPIPDPLTNFDARILRDVSEDDGAEVRRSFEIEATLRRRVHRFSVPAADFRGMSWVAEHLGARAIVYPGPSRADHARTAIQLGSEGIVEETVFAHLGFRETNGGHVYLHAGGALGADGRAAWVNVRVAEALARYSLPDPDPDAIPAAVHASLRMLDTAPDAITVPLWLSAWRAPLGDVDFSVHLAGPTGEGKSEQAALVAQHFGAGLDARHLPGSWMSTGNALEGTAFVAKDTVYPVDDFAPTGNQTDVNKMHAQADRLFRAQGNHAGRMRMRADATLRPAKPPRCLILSTGEDIPRGQSLRGRLLTLEMEPGAVDWAKLTGCQADAAAGAYAMAMAGYVQHLARDLDGARRQLREDADGFRERLRVEGHHRRTPGIVAQLAAGLKAFAGYAMAAGALDRAEAEALWRRCWAALVDAAAAQPQHHLAAEPTRVFRTLLASALASGRAHVASAGGLAPRTPEAWGWREVVVGVEDVRAEWRPQGDRIGWLEGEDLYLEPGAAFAVVQDVGKRTGEPLVIGAQTLRKRLHERALLASTDRARQTLTVRRVLEGTQRTVLHLRVSDFGASPDGEPDISDISDNQHERGDSSRHEGAQQRPISMSGFGSSTENGNPTNPTSGGAWRRCVLCRGLLQRDELDLCRSCERRAAS